MENRTYTFDNYRFGFNGKERDNEGEWGELTHYDYGFRIYNPSIARFLSVDPLAPDYPSWTPYAFAMNRVIDGIDLDGLEWDYYMNSNNDGRTIITVNVSPQWGGASSEMIQNIRAEAQRLFSSMIQTASGGNATGQLTFNEQDASTTQFVPSILFYTDPVQEGGTSVSGVSSGETGIAFSLYNAKGEMNSIQNLANTVVHELLHTVRIETWENQTPDTELIRVGKEYQTTENTHPSIYQNILMYGFHVIDGISLKDRLNEGESLNQISPDQLKLMLQEIDLQKQGYGVHNYDSEKSAEENAAEYEEKVFYYWLDVPKLKE